MGHLFSSSKPLPSKVDLRERFALPKVYQQGQCGDCTSNAWCGLYEIESIIKNFEPTFRPSRLFLYFNERNLPQDKILEISKKEQQGGFLVNGLISLSFQGVCSEAKWPYDLSKVDVKPTEDCYVQGLEHQIIQGNCLDQTLIHMKTCLNSNHPFVFAFDIYSNFHDSNFKNGIMLMPTPSSTQIGRHAVVAVGYDDALNTILCRNSWGSKWGMEGYFWMPYEFIMNPKYAREFYFVENIN